MKGGRTMSPTIKDVAKEAGVSIATLSKVINGKPSISEPTRQRVLHKILLIYLCQTNSNVNPVKPLHITVSLNKSDTKAFFIVSSFTLKKS